MLEWFNDRKAAQVVAFFCEKEGGEIDVLKVVKLVYLADREAMASWGFPITNDKHVSMPHGPVNSLTYEMIGGGGESEDWQNLLSDRKDYRIALARALGEDDDDELSDAEIEAMNAVWDRFGSMSKYEVRDWTHDHCPEWEDPNGSSTPIPHDRTLRFLNVENPDKFAERIEVNRSYRSIMSELRKSVAG